MVEVMIAVFVLAIGLLGVAGLQLSSIKNNHTAYVRTQAISLASNLADRMRANVGGSLAGNYLGNIALNSTGTTQNCALGYSTATPNVCTASQLAADDLFRWFELAKAGVPQTSASITCTTPAGVLITANGTPCPITSKHTITITWSEQDGTAGLVSKSTSLEFQP